MDRDEFMELVYETFADEPDNVLANGIIEAADAYVEHEKAQLSQEGTTSDLISRTETVERLRGVVDVTVPITDYDGGYVDGVEVGISTVSTMPTIQSQSTAGQLNDSAQSTNLIDRQEAIDVLHGYFDGMLDTDTVCPEDIYGLFECIPSAQPETAKRIVGKSRDGMTLWYQCDMCNEPVNEQDNYCRGCGRRLIDG